MDLELESAVKYALSLQGVPFRRWHGTRIMPNAMGPFYARLEPGTLPTHGELAKYGMSCTGLINLMRHYAGRAVPDTLADYPGSVGSWWLYLTLKNGEREGAGIRTFDPASNYPRGSLLMRPYKDIYAQGHVAVLLDENVPAIESQLLHCYDPVGVHVDLRVEKSHRWFVDGYYQFVIAPELWFYL